MLSPNKSPNKAAGEDLSSSREDATGAEGWTLGRWAVYFNERLDQALARNNEPMEARQRDAATITKLEAAEEQSRLRERERKTAERARRAAEAERERERADAARERDLLEAPAAVPPFRGAKTQGRSIPRVFAREICSGVDHCGAAAEQ